MNIHAIKTHSRRQKSGGMLQREDVLERNPVISLMITLLLRTTLGRCSAPCALRARIPSYSPESNQAQTSWDDRANCKIPVYGQRSFQMTKNKKSEPFFRRFSTVLTHKRFCLPCFPGAKSKFGHETGAGPGRNSAWVAYGLGNPPPLGVVCTLPAVVGL